MSFGIDSFQWWNEDTAHYISDFLCVLFFSVVAFKHFRVVAAKAGELLETKGGMVLLDMFVEAPKCCSQVHYVKKSKQNQTDVIISINLETCPNDSLMATLMEDLFLKLQITGVNYIMCKSKVRY